METSAGPPSARRGGHCCRPRSALLFATRERHDLVGGQATGRLALEVLDDAPTASTLAAAPSLSDSDRGAFDRELHFAVGEQAEPLANLDGNRHLSFRCDAHGSPPLGNTSMSLTIAGRRDPRQPRHTGPARRALHALIAVAICS